MLFPFGFSPGLVIITAAELCTGVVEKGIGPFIEGFAEKNVELI